MEGRDTNHVAQEDKEMEKQHSNMSKHKEGIEVVPEVDLEQPVIIEHASTSTILPPTKFMIEMPAGATLPMQSKDMILPPRITDKVVFTDNYPQGYGKKLTAFIMAVDENWVAHLATLDPTQNPLCHPRPGVPYDQSGRPGSWAFLLEK